MTIYEENDFDKIFDPNYMDINRAADKLKRMRLEKKRQEELRVSDDIPTAEDLERAFNED